MRSALRVSLLGAFALAAMPIRDAGAQVAFERAGYRLTSIGERITVSGNVLDVRRQPVSSTNIRWRIADPEIASVTPQGVVVSRKVGRTKLWAVSGDDSASALILVDQWAARFDFVPATLRLDAVGAKALLRIIVRDAGGHPIASATRRPTSCRSLNDAIASLGPTGEVVARRNGVTWVRCADRGIADSARIEVRQRPARATIADKLNFNNRVVGDTFRLRVSAIDAAGDVIPGVAATWASLNPTIVTVDPLTGLARMVGPGTARVVAQAGDVTDTVSIGVSSGFGLAVPVHTEPGSDPGVLLAGRVPTLKVDGVYPFTGDTTTVRVSARDANGVEVPNPAVALSSSDTSVFVVLSRHRIAARKSGSAYLIGRFGTSTIDSAQIIVRDRGSITRVAAAEEQRSNFRRPTYNVDSLRRVYDRSRDSATKQIFDSTRVRGLKAPGRLVSVSGIMGYAAHSFADSTGKEKRSGLMYGGLVELAPIRWVRVTGELKTGSLTSKGSSGTDLTVTEAIGGFVIQPTDQFSFGGTYTMRATREGPSGTPLALQQWTIPRAFATMRLGFVGGAVRTVMGINTTLPGSSYTGYVDAQGNPLAPETLSLGGEAGIDVRLARMFRIGLLYNIESLSFPEIGTSVRRDQFSAVKVKFGLEYSR
jgi:Big-like domain-containing protein